MSKSFCTTLAALILLLSAQAGSTAGQGPAATIPLTTTDGLEAADAKIEIVDYRGRKAIKLIPPKGANPDNDMLAILKTSNFKDGTIEAEIAGFPRPDAPSDARGFIGIAFRLQDNTHYECFYIRPTNGRADDQLRRNHTTQYESSPDYPWFRLRKENPGVYESYADVENAAWTKLKIVVTGAKAQLFINDAPQPALIVNDLKRGETSGRVALWANPTTDAYFSNLKIL